MYDGHLIDAFMDLVERTMDQAGYPPADRDDEDEPEIPLLLKAA